MGSQPQVQQPPQPVALAGQQPGQRPVRPLPFGQRGLVAYRFAGRRMREAGAADQAGPLGGGQRAPAQPGQHRGIQAVVEGDQQQGAPGGRWQGAQPGPVRATQRAVGG